MHTDTTFGRRPLISISIPVLNEADNLDALYARLDQLSKAMAAKCEFEFVFSDNHSDDQTWDMLNALARLDPRVRAIRFSKNVGFQRSILANYMHTRGDAVLQIDADLQDPPELLEQFFDLWQQGNHVVYGVRAKRPEGVFINSFRKFGYWIIDRISEHPIPRDAGDFRLVDRKVIDSVQKFRSTSPYLRGLIAGLGFKQVGVPYERAARVAGSSKFGLAQLVRLGMTGVFNHSVVPLRIATYSGLFLLALSVLGALYYAGLRLFQPNLPRGLASIHILVLFGIGFQSLLLGILGEYLQRIYILLRAEPTAIVEQALNIAANELKL
ncbi:glycosyltransferase family 2 protein [Caballeronia sp. SBC2]|uniref:glycosyltransferase family 2 protein n=1 Tax=Caballeronia sp. SBC2 TaxID=2705547 RepID=UPI0013E1333B|nr:glycosyltransferase family 2 protein [Caballeronia sp. SBC2]QIE24833.1 putative glycosyltransferase [Caballeronia sp. SBC2]